MIGTSCLCHRGERPRPPRRRRRRGQRRPRWHERCGRASSWIGTASTSAGWSTGSTRRPSGWRCATGPRRRTACSTTGSSRRFRRYVRPLPHPDEDTELKTRLQTIRHARDLLADVVPDSSVNPIRMHDSRADASCQAGHTRHADPAGKVGRAGQSSPRRASPPFSHSLRRLTSTTRRSPSRLRPPIANSRLPRRRASRRQRPRSRRPGPPLPGRRRPT